MRILTGVVCVIVGLCAIAGCHRGVAAVSGDRELLSVDFKQGQVLRYKKISERETQLDFDPSGKISKGTDKGRMQTMTERLEIVVAYKSIKVDPKGFTTVEATFEQVRPSRSSLTGSQPSGKDATGYLQGKTVTFTLSPSGMITDQAGLNDMVTQLGEQAFGGKGGKGIKDPDMIQDLMALEWTMWDVVSSIKRPAQGVAVGQAWQSQLMAPMPMPMRIGRDTTYKLERVEDVNGIRIADINSIDILSETVPPPTVWPLPYTGSFQMRGVFGFLSGYKVLSLTGGGRQIFNITEGKIERVDQRYEANVAANMPFGLGAADDSAPMPNIFVRQKISIELLK